MDDPKYIIYENQAYIFPCFVDHSKFARRNNFDEYDIQGAGFLAHGINGPSCYGQSISLGIKSRGNNDTECVKNLFYRNWLNDLKKRGYYRYE